jgi:hypothetical protein
MAATATRVTVSTVAVALNGADTGPSGTGLLIRAGGVGGTNDVCIGDSGVTNATGYLLAAATNPIWVSLGAGEVLYAVRAGGADGTLHVIATGG